ncbi:DUF2750 domain-containing protein [Staphylococcus hominis]|uniref:DUF2750 domain-containing protein n=1 Tax=Staphylococcus hominis TaxID=1290 RepID=A0A974KX07_STAHO|nr:DUF2750 domain-containing protein [Staphylococcus hominis]PTK30178.1 DUF2750 domain-containing protein [Staphylococcus hominis]RIO58611.1 DUF2750 domain-containing protein [Staphylococcus hominis]
MEYKHNDYFKEILVNEVIILASKNKKLIRIHHEDGDYTGMWTNEDIAKEYLNHSDIQFDRLLNIDIDTFVTYDMDELFDESDKILINTSSKEEGHIVKVVDMMDELMSELDKIRLKEFAKDISKENHVFGLTRKGEKRFILISDKENQKPNIMPVWSIKNRARKVRDKDFEECDLIEIEGSVFSEWLDKLRDNDQAVAVDLKPGVVGTIVSPQKVSNELSF